MHEKRGQNMKGLKNNLLTYRQWLLSLRGCALQGLYVLSMSDWDQANVYCFYGIRVILTVSMVTLILTFLCQQVHAYCLYGNRWYVYCFYGYRLIHKLEDVSLDQDDRHSILSTQTLHRPLWNVVAGYSINDINMEINRMSWIDKDGVPIKYALDSYNIPL